MISRLQSRETFERVSHFPQVLRGRSPHLFIAGGVEPLRGSTCSMAERKLPTMRLPRTHERAWQTGRGHLRQRARIRARCLVRLQPGKLGGFLPRGPRAHRVQVRVHLREVAEAEARLLDYVEDGA